MLDFKIFTMNDIEAQPVSWLWETYIPRGKITVVQGDPGEGKTTMMLAVAAAITNGGALPDGFCDVPANVIFQTAEDGLADTIKPRLKQLDADCSRIYVIDEGEKMLSLADERIERAIIETNAKLLIIDPIQAYLGGADMNNAKGMRPLMKSLGEMAERTGCAVVIIGHLNKSRGARAQYRGLGSIDIYAAARSVLTVEKINENMKRIIHQKSNITKKGAPIAFSFDIALGFCWHGKYDIDADDIFDNMGSERESQFDRAKNLIIDILSDGAAEAAIIIQTAEKHGISEKTLNRAKSSLGVYSVKRGGRWFWEMPVETSFVDFRQEQGGQARQGGHMAALTIFENYRT